jgi:uncharacterized membrane protein YccF (DUF307 family)
MSQEYSQQGYEQRQQTGYQQPQAFQQVPQPPHQQSYMTQPPQYPPVQQPPLYAQQGHMQPPVIMNTNINMNVQQPGHSLLIRGLYFVFVGWWAGLLWLNLGFFLCALIVTLPVGLIMLNRLPQVMTLKPAGTNTSVNVSTTTIQAGQYGQSITTQNINVSVGGTQQYSFLIRTLYFLFIGWWAGYIWANLAYLCCVLIVLLPVGIIMFDRLPMVLTLRKN